MNMIIDRHKIVDDIHYKVSGVSGADWEAKACKYVEEGVTLQVKNFITGDKYKLQHIYCGWDFVRRMVPLAILFIKPHFIYRDKHGIETEASKLFHFYSPGRRRFFCIENETYDFCVHADYITSISLPDKQIAVCREVSRDRRYHVNQYEMQYSKCMSGKEHILLLLLLFHDRTRVARRQAAGPNGGTPMYNWEPLDRRKHRAKWRPEDDDGFE